MVSAVLNLFRKEKVCCERAASDCTYLSDLQPGEYAQVIGFEAGGNRCINDECGSCAVSKLECMGLHIGAEIEIITNSGKGPVVFRVEDSRLALGRGISSKIIIKK